MFVFPQPKWVILDCYVARVASDTGVFDYCCVVGVVLMVICCGLFTFTLVLGLVVILVVVL